jgi:hypothetical protein
VNLAVELSLQPASRGVTTLPQFGTFAVRLAWIAAEKAGFRVSACCRAIDVAPSGFYACRQRPPSALAQVDARLRVMVRASAHCRERPPTQHDQILGTTCVIAYLGFVGADSLSICTVL